MTDITDEAINALSAEVRQRVQAILEDVELRARRSEDHACELEAQLEDAESRVTSADVFEDWIDQVVRETEGRMLDGVSPALILVALVDELSTRRSMGGHNGVPLLLVVT